MYQQQQRHQYVYVPVDRTIDVHCTRRDDKRQKKEKGKKLEIEHRTRTHRRPNVESPTPNKRQTLNKTRQQTAPSASPEPEPGRTRATAERQRYLVRPKYLLPSTQYTWNEAARWLPMNGDRRPATDDRRQTNQRDDAN